MVLIEKKLEKGISLLVAIFVSSIALAIVLGIGSILLSQIKIVRDMGSSVQAFYAADTAIEKIMYVDNKEGGEMRGICGICNQCPNNGIDGSFLTCACSISGDDCTGCTNCSIRYNGSITSTNESFETEITINSASGDYFKSYGNYRGTRRAIELLLAD